MRKVVNLRWRAGVLAVVSLGLILSLAVRPKAAGSPTLVISQVYGAGGNTDAVLKNDFIEIFNRGTSPVSLAGMSVQYASASGSGNFGSSTSQLTSLPALTLQPGQYLLIQEAGGTIGAALPTPDTSGSINMSGSAGKVALVNSTASLGCNGGSTACTPAQLALIVDLVGYGNANFFEGSGAARGLGPGTAAVRANAGCSDTDTNATDFVAAAPSPRNTATALHVCPAASDPTGIGSAMPASVDEHTPTLLTVAVTPGANPASTGLAVVADLSSVGGGAAQAFYDDGTNGDAVAGDNTFSYRLTPTIVAAGALPVTITDAQGRTGAASISLVVTTPPLVLAIHDIQGNGTESPYVGQRVAVRGVVTGVKYNGFFVQATADQVDADPATSEGVFVYTGNPTPLPALRGNLVDVVGAVKEYGTMTEIADAPTVALVSVDQPLPPPVTITADMTSPAGTFTQLEPLEGMRVRVESLTATSPTGTATVNGVLGSDGQFFAVVTGVARPFREPGLEPSAPEIPGMPAGTPRFDGNPERLIVDTDALGAPALAVAAGSVLTNVVGPLDCISGTYAIDPENEPTVVQPTYAPVPVAGEGQFTVASFNMLDFGNPKSSLPPLADRLTKASRVIREVMRMPDIIGVEEVMNLATLQALAAQVNAEAAPDTPGYTAALVPAPSGTQHLGLLLRSSVKNPSITQVGADVRFADPRDGSMDLLNDRPPLVMRATVTDKRGGPDFPVTVIVNHLRSLIDADANSGAGQYARAKRQKGAEYLASLVDVYQKNGEHVVSVGDYNAFQFNDGYVDVIGTVVGEPAAADKVLLSSTDLVDPNLTDLIDLADAAERYSYVESGNAQALDHVLVSANMLPRAARLAYGRVDADFPASYAWDPSRPERLSDHDPAVAYFTFPTADLSVSVGSAPPTTVLTGSPVTFTVTVANDAADEAQMVVLKDTLPDGATVTSASGPAGWTCDTTAATVTCSAASLAAHSTATFTIVAQIACDLPSGNLESTLKVETATYDPTLDNNEKKVITTVSNPAPTIGSASATPSLLWPVNHKLVPIRLDYTATDNCDPAPQCVLTVKSSEPTDGRGDGQTATDWQVLNAHNLMLRAERSGTGAGRSYTIDIACSDASGNTTTQSVHVTVPKSQGQK